MDGQVIAESLGSNSTLEILDLGWNAVNQDALWGFHESLGINTTLKQLKLSNNSIGADDACVITEILRVNKGLERLEVDHNPLGRIGARTIVHTLIKRQLRVQVTVLVCADSALMGRLCHCR